MVLNAAPTDLLPLPNTLSGIRLVAADLDGTLTVGGRLSAPVLLRFQSLAANNIPVLLVTGRSAGWVAGLRAYLPGLVGAIAENGGLCFRADPDSAEQMLTAIPDLKTHRNNLRAQFERLRALYPRLEEAADNAFRLTDWTFTNRDLAPKDLLALRQACTSQGWGFTYSSVQCHISLPGQDKATGVTQVLKRWFSDPSPGLSPSQVLTVGDSPNDDSLFNPALFPNSVGVADLRAYTAQLTYRPRYVTTACEGEGFCELASTLIRSLKAQP